MNIELVNDASIVITLIPELRAVEASVDGLYLGSYGPGDTIAIGRGSLNVGSFVASWANRPTRSTQEREAAQRFLKQGSRGPQAVKET
jgi:hypothetical protein